MKPQYTKKYKRLATDRISAILNDREAELDVLYSIVFNEANAYKVSRLTEDDFYSNDTKEVYKFLKEEISSGKKVDLTMLPKQLTIADLSNRFVMTSNIDLHIDKLREIANLRKLQDIAYLATAAATEGKKFKEIKSYIYSELDKIKIAGNGASQIAACDDKYDEYLQTQDNLIIKTGYTKLDWVTGGFLNGSLNVIASAQGLGKTSFALNIVDHVCRKLKKKVLYVSLEMSYLAIYGKLISLLSKQSFSEVMAGKLKTDGGWAEFDEHHWRQINNARAAVYGWQLYFCGEQETGTADIEDKIKEINDIDLVVIDYLQLIKPSKSGSIYETTSATSRELKMLAMKYNLPFLAINSINRDYSNRADYKPHISDLRNSGQLEYDADMILLLHRPSMFREAKNGENKHEFEHKAEVIIAKNRLGEANIELDFYFDGKTGMFKEAAVGKN